MATSTMFPQRGTPGNQPNTSALPIYSTLAQTTHTASRPLEDHSPAGSITYWMVAKTKLTSSISSMIHTLTANRPWSASVMAWKATMAVVYRLM